MSLLCTEKHETGGVQMKSTKSHPPPTPPGAALRTLIRVVAVLLLFLVLHQLLNWANAEAALGTSRLRAGMLVLFLLAYAILIAVPFIPGVEVGLTLMAMEGPWIAPWIYCATVVGLSLAFVLGESVSYRRLHTILADLHMRRVCLLIERVQPLNKADRLAMLQDRAPKWARPFVSRFRYVAMALLINLPGNSILGGGGGLMFIAGFSRLFHTIPMIGVTLLTVLPVPLAVWLFKVDIRSLF